MNPGDPTLTGKIMNKNVPMFLDTGAHVSVLPKPLVKEVLWPLALEFPSGGPSSRHIKVFGGQEIILDGPIELDVTICGLQLVHPFLYVDADIPALGGYDLLRAAQIMIDAHAGEVWSKHTNVAHQVSSLENILVTVPSQSLVNDNVSSLTAEKVPAPCVVAETTSSALKDVPLSAFGVTTHRVSSAAPTSCIQNDTLLTATYLPPHSLNSLAPSFDPTEMETDRTETELTSDEIPDHINLREILLEFRDPLISRERLKLETSNLAWRQKAVSSNDKMQN